jgi:hypothetical protein
LLSYFFNRYLRNLKYFCPIQRNKKSAMELSIKTVPNAVEICFSFDFIMDEMAALALPPQIAVPVDIRYEVLFSCF